MRNGVHSIITQLRLSKLYSAFFLEGGLAIMEPYTSRFALLFRLLEHKELKELRDMKRIEGSPCSLQDTDASVSNSNSDSSLSPSFCIGGQAQDQMGQYEYHQPIYKHHQDKQQQLNHMKQKHLNQLQQYQCSYQYQQPQSQLQQQQQEVQQQIQPQPQSQAKNKYDINANDILSGKETRTTIMMKNLPNKFNTITLIQILNEKFKGKFDLVYLPIDSKLKKNYGYAFINFTSPLHVIKFHDEFNGEKWLKTNSKKICEVTYSKLQGREKMMKHYPIKAMYSANNILNKNESNNSNTTHSRSNPLRLNHENCVNANANAHANAHTNVIHC